MSEMDLEESRKLANRIIKSNQDLYPDYRNLSDTVLAKAHLALLERVKEYEIHVKQLETSVTAWQDQHDKNYKKIEELEALLRIVLTVEPKNLEMVKERIIKVMGKK